MKPDRVYAVTPEDTKTVPIPTFTLHTTQEGAEQRIKRDGLDGVKVVVMLLHKEE